MPKNNVQQSDEIKNLSELMHDFQSTWTGSVEDALKEIKERFDTLISDEFRELIEPIFLRIDPQGNKHLDFTRIPYVVHYIMFDEILSNAGNYRSKEEKNNGYVGFGGANFTSRGGMKHSGNHPDKIVEKINEACSFLQYNADDPVEASIEFFQRFVKCHPFYDGNGRVARFIVTVYLDLHRLHVDWELLNSDNHQEEFFQKLNRRHKKMDFNNSSARPKLVAFFKQFIKVKGK